MMCPGSDTSSIIPRENVRAVTKSVYRGPHGEIYVPVPWCACPYMVPANYTATEHDAIDKVMKDFSYDVHRMKHILKKLLCFYKHEKNPNIVTRSTCARQTDSARRETGKQHRDTLRPHLMRLLNEKVEQAKKHGNKTTTIRAVRFAKMLRDEGFEIADDRRVGCMLRTLSIKYPDAIVPQPHGHRMRVKIENIPGGVFQ